MVRSFKRKNNALNNAASGLASGLQAGLGLGMQRRQIDNQEKRDDFYRTQALREAQNADQEIQREKSLRDVNAEAVGIANEPMPDVVSNSGVMSLGPAVASARSGVEMDKRAERIVEIGKKMAILGSPLDRVQKFADEAVGAWKKADDAERRKNLIDQISHLSKDGTMFGTNPDGSRTENPETEASLKKLVDLASIPDVPVEMLRGQLLGLKRAQQQDRTRLAHRTSMTARLDQDIATVDQSHSTQAGPITPMQADAQSRQLQRLQSLRDQFEVFYDEIHGTKGGSMSFAQQWANAKQGISFVNPRTGNPVTFAEEDSVREAEQYIQQQDQELARLKAETESARKPLIEAQTNAENALAEWRRTPKEKRVDQNTDSRLAANPLFKKDGVPQWAFDNPEIVKTLETLPPSVLKLGAEKAKKFYEDAQNIPPEKRDQFLKDWVDEGGDIDVEEWMRDNE